MSNRLARLISLAGRRAVVCGGGGGIGSAVTRLFLEAGAEVTSLDLPGRSAPAGARSVDCDVADAAAVKAFFEDLEEREERLDALVHCAGITRDGVLWKMPDEAWSAVLRVNLDSAFYLLKGAAPLLRRTGDAAVALVSSINGERGKFGQANYAASKAGLIGLGRTAACELGRFGVRVNLITPGLVRTSMAEALPEEHLQAAIEESVLGRIAEPEDIAAAALFLCSPLSRHVTGQVLRVDGGQLIA